MKNFLKTFERVFVYYFASVGLSLLATVLLNVPLKFFLKNYNNAVNFAIHALLMLVLLFIFFYRDGYKTKKLEMKYFLPSLAVILLLLVTALFVIGHAVYIAGPTEFLDEYFPKMLIQSPINPKVTVNLISAVLMISAFFLLYTPTILIAEHIGIKQAR